MNEEVCLGNGEVERGKKERKNIEKDRRREGEKEQEDKGEHR